MANAELLRLAAIDTEDLAVVSAYVQDAVLKVGDMTYLPHEHRFVVAMNRFIWEKADSRRADYERRRAALSFDRVIGVKASHIDRGRPDAVLELLAVNFEATGGPDDPGGAVTLVFAGGGAVQLTIEVIEVRLADLGAAWATAAKPAHDLSGDAKPSA
jgi:hypothetical protein